MTATNRIILNTVATYSRSLLSLGMGLFSVRWVLAALGKSDFGLFGVVGGIVMCVQLLNIVMSNAVSRYYAFAIGKAERIEEVNSSCEELSAWFNSAASIHFVLPIMLILIGYPIGVWAIEHWLTIPADRVYACVWVFRLTLVAAFFNMATVPYIAMYRARQLIVELTVWDILRSVITFIGAFLLQYIRGDCLIAYAGIMALGPVLVVLIQVYRARRRFDCCHLHFRKLFDFTRMRQIAMFGGCDLFSSLGIVVRDNGAAFIINKLFGPIANSSYSVANQLSAHTNTLASAMQGALVPAITTSEGAGRHVEAVKLSYRSCKFFSLLVLVFAVPLYIEAENVINLWLVNPPENSALLCRCVLVSLLCSKVGLGYHMTLLALGKVGLYQFTLGIVSYLTLPMMYVLSKMYGVAGVGYTVVINALLQSIVRVLFAHFLAGVKVVNWFVTVVIPVVIVAMISGGIGFVSSYYMPETFTRICLTTLISITALAVAGMYLAMDQHERGFLINAIAAIKKRL